MTMNGASPDDSVGATNFQARFEDYLRYLAGPVDE